MDTSPDIVPVALIGLSRYARDVHIPYVQNDSRLRLVAASTSNPGRPAPEPLPGEATIYTDYRQMLIEVAPRVVMVSSAPMPHFEQIRAALQAGAHVLTDKAMVCSQEQAEEIVALAESSGLLLGVVVQRRYETALQHIRQVIKAGILGEIRVVRANYARSYPKDPGHWRNDPAVAWGGMLADNGYHLLDTTLWITMLRPVRVYAELSFEALRVEQTAVLSWQFAGGAVGGATLTYIAPAGYIREEIFIHGTSGAIFFQRQQNPGGPLTAQVTHLDANGIVQPIPAHEHTADRQAPHRNFFNALLQGEPLLADGRSNIPAVALIDAAYRAARQGKPEPISLGESFH